MKLILITAITFSFLVLAAACLFLHGATWIDEVAGAPDWGAEEEEDENDNS